jgi:hypothetical protein
MTVLGNFAGNGGTICLVCRHHGTNAHGTRKIGVEPQLTIHEERSGRPEAIQRSQVGAFLGAFIDIRTGDCNIF